MPQATATKTLSHPQKTAWGTLILLGTACVTAAIFLVAFALPYFLWNPEKMSLYTGKEAWILLHLAGGTVALALGPFVIWLGLKRRRKGLHRKLGVGYMVSIAFSSVAAYYLAFHTNVGWIFGMGLTGLATAWVLTTGLAFVSIRRRLVDQHKEWMIRSYVVTFGFVNFRIAVGILGALGIGTLTDQLTAASWSCWAFPLLITEVLLQGAKILKVTALPPPR